jgi:flagellar motor switch protein FliN/FliY
VTLPSVLPDTPREAFEACASALTMLLGRDVKLVGVTTLGADAAGRSLPGPWVVADAGPGAAPIAAMTLDEARALARAVLGEDAAEGVDLTPSECDALREGLQQALAAAAAIRGGTVTLDDLRVVAGDHPWPLPGPEVVLVSLALAGAPPVEVRLAVASGRAADRGAPAPSSTGTDGGHGLGVILDITMPVRIELGRTRMLIRDILALRPGAIVELDKLAGEAVDVMVNDRRIARGEVVVVDERFGVRLTEIAAAADRLDSLR